MQSSPFIPCVYCMKRDHTIRSYRVRNHDLRNGLVKRVPKGANNNIGPK